MTGHPPYLHPLCILAIVLSGAVCHGQVFPNAQSRRVQAQEEFPDLAQELENPLARVLIFPLNFRYEDGGGPEGDGSRFVAKFSPSIPFTLGDDWHLLWKTDISWVSQEDATAIPGTQEGWSDMLQTLFVTPRRSIGWDSYWGIGPTIGLPIASEDGLGSDKYSAGPSIAVYRQKGAWTAGILLNHVWSFAGEDDAPDVSVTLLEPTLSYTTDKGTTLRLNSEIRHDWEREKWSAPLQVGVGQLTLVRGHPVKFGLGYSHFILDEGNAPDWAVEFQITVPVKSPRWSIIR